jgi:hypothetical protein
MLGIILILVLAIIFVRLRGNQLNEFKTRRGGRKALEGEYGCGQRHYQCIANSAEMPVVISPTVVFSRTT